MLGGYMGRVLRVDLSSGKFEDEPLSEEQCLNYLGGYGIGLRLIYDRQRPGADPLGPESILAFATGPLTGTPALIGSRFTVMGKSPLTGTWGDANAAGYFGPALKQAGYDGVFFTGASDTPVYLLIDNGKPEIRSAFSLWGKTTYETEDMLKREHGDDIQVACIGPAGEKGSLISCVIHDKGRAAGRFGLGAALGAKKIKAVAVRGSAEVPVACVEGMKDLRKKYLHQMTVEKVGASSVYAIGTPCLTAPAALNGDSPVRNWAGACSADFGAEAARPLQHENLFRYRTKKYGCWRCPIACGGIVAVESALYRVEEAHQPEYETMSAFGPNCMNSDIESIIKANDICNSYGLDTISTGALVAFAMECYEKGFLTPEDADGLDLSWGNPEAVVKLTEKIARREGLGAILSLGLDKAARAIGKGADEFAIHVRGDAIAMHDPRFEPALAVIYKMFPGKHIQASQFCKPPGLDEGIPGFGADREKQAGRGKALKLLECLCNVVNCSGVCLFGYLSTYVDCIPEFLTAVTGVRWSLEDTVKAGERISNLRQAFNIREGANLIKSPFPSRVLGSPPLDKGPTAGFKVDMELILSEYLDAMGWSRDEARPSTERLVQLGMEDVARDLLSLPQATN
ncbi:MAG: aldehyde ferredoxin oxidoreductase family protein [Bacillota bacterium]